MSISTHVLDAVVGRPAASLPVVLSRRTGDDWVEVSSRVTDADGRVADLAPSAEPGGDQAASGRGAGQGRCDARRDGFPPC